MTPHRAQQGYFIILAVIFILIMGVMGTLIAYIFSSRALISAAQLRGLRAFYLTESGLEITSRYLTRPSLNTSPTRIACGSVTANAELTGGAVANGTFTATASAPSVISTTLNGVITSSSSTIALASTASLATFGRVLIDKEYIDYNAISGSSLINVTRGADATTAASHANSEPVSQYQCTLDVQGGEPSIASPSYQRELQWGVPLQDGWVVGSRAGNNYSLFRWNVSTELSWNNNSFGAASIDDRANLNDVSVLSNSDGWAVGNEATNQFVFLRWNGSSWTANLLAGACINQNLNGVSMVSLSEGWAVGARYRPACASSGSFRYTILQWNGSNWSLLTPTTIPSDANGNQHLNAVQVIDSNADGVGDLGFAVGNGGIILQYNGSTWSSVTSPTSNDLQSVKIVSSSEAWAVGTGGVILKWNGSSWSSVSSPTTTQLNDVSMLDSSNDGTADYGIAVGSAGTIATYNGSSWSATTSGINDLFGISVISSQDAWAVGDNGVLQHWDGSSWSTTTTSPDSTWNSIVLLGAKQNRVSSWRQTFH